MGRVYEVEGKQGISCGVDVWVQGRRIRRIIGQDRKQAEKELKRLEAKALLGDSAGAYGERKIRCLDFAEIYLDHKRATTALTSHARYEKGAKILVYAFGDRLMSKIYPDDLERLRAARAKAVGAWTVYNEFTTVKEMFRLAVRWGYLHRNPAESLKVPQGKYRLRYFTEAEEQLLLAFCHQDIYPIVSLALYTGMRQREILELTWGRVDLNAGTIFLPDPKSKEPQTVFLNEAAIEELRRIPRRPETQRVFSISVWMLGYRFRQACRQAGIKDATFHTCRHTFCSRLIMRGANFRAVQALARHKSPSMTARYTHLRDDFLAETVRLLRREGVEDLSKPE